MYTKKCVEIYLYAGVYIRLEWKFARPLSVCVCLAKKNAVFTHDPFLLPVYCILRIGIYLLMIYRETVTFTSLCIIVIALHTEHGINIQIQIVFTKGILYVEITCICLYPCASVESLTKCSSAKIILRLFQSMSRSLSFSV